MDASKLDPVAKLQYLSLVNKICKELDSHIGVSDKTLAEFIIDLALQHPDQRSFTKALEENGAEFPPSFCSNLLTLVAKMAPKSKERVASATKVTSWKGICTGRLGNPANMRCYAVMLTNEATFIAIAILLEMFCN